MILPDFSTVAEAPSWALGLTAKQKLDPRKAAEGVELDLPAALDQGRALIERWLRTGDVPVKGQRNEHAFRCFAELKDLALSPETARAFYEQLYAPGSGGDPPDFEGDFEDVIRRLWSGKTGQNEVGSKLLPTATEALGEAAAAHIEPVRWRFIEVDEALDAPPVKFWDANNNFPQVPGGAIGLLISGYGTLKTQHAIAMSLDCPRKPRVLYCMGEGHGGMGARLNAIMLSRQLERAEVRARLKLAEVPIISDPSDLEGFQQWLRESAREWRPDIIWIDTLATALGPLDDSNSLAGWYLAANGPLGKVARDRNCLIMFCHHTNWDGQEPKKGTTLRGRGTSAIEGNTAVALTLERNRGAGVTKINRKRAKFTRDGDGCNTFFEVVELGGGIPVPQQINASLYDMLSGSTEAMSLHEVGSKLDVLQAHGEAKAVTTFALVAALYEKQRAAMAPEDWDRAINRMARKLERQREALNAYNNAALGGGAEGRPLLWFKG